MFFSGGPWLVGMVFFVAGGSLFETLALNWLQYAPDHPRPNLDKTPDDCPNWERDDPFIPERELPLGYLDYLTWPNRRILLLPEDGPDGVRVREVIDAPGLKLRGEVQDPFKHYEQTDRGLTFLYLNPAKALWRDSHTLLGIRSEGKKPVQALTWLANLAGNGIVPEHARYQLTAVGVVSKQAKVDLARMEQISLPVNLLRQNDKVGIIKELIEKSENIRKSLWGALYRLAEQLIAMQSNQADSRKPDPKDVRGLVAHWDVEPLYWQSLEQPFMRLLDELANGADGDLIQARWQKILQRSVWSALEAAIAQAGEFPQALKAAVLARAQLAAGWKKTYPDRSN
jgi:CRISPR system Cascade subunit CasA